MQSLSPQLTNAQKKNLKIMMEYIYHNNKKNIFSPQGSRNNLWFDLFFRSKTIDS